MLRNYLLTTYRNMLRKPVFSLINISGLAIGMAAFMMIVLYVADELSYDRFHQKSDRIFRVTIHGVFANNVFNTTYTAAPLAQALISEFPEVEQVSRIMLRNQHSVAIGNQTFIEDQWLYADSTFFDVFSFGLIEGDPEKVLAEPRSLVLTESTARKWFGNESPIGKTIIDNNRHHYVVTGIMKDVPANAHFRFNVVASFTSLNWHNNSSWFNQSAQTYLVLREGTDAQELQTKLPDFLYRSINEQLKQFLGISVDEFAQSGQSYELRLQPVTEIHLNSQLEGELDNNGSMASVYLFSMIALFILLIACINFMNLSTARSAWRAKEVGIRKALGSNRADLIRQFLGESVLYAFVAALLAVILMELSMPYFNLITQKQLGFNLSNTIFFLPFLLLLVVFTGLLAGSYPAYYLSAFQPLEVLKGQQARGAGRNRLRSYLVLLQYSISIILLISTFVVYQQLQFVQDKNPGYQKENVVLIKRVHGLGDKLDVFKQDILSHPNILSASYALDMPGDDYSTNSVGVAGRPLEEVNIMAVLFADYDLEKVMGMNMAQGRWFSREFGTDTAVAVVNEAALRALSIKDFTTEKIVMHSTPPHPHWVLPIIGVVKDFHYESLHHGIRPMIILLRTEGWFNRMAVRISEGTYAESLEILERKWNGMETGQPFMYTSLDQNMEAFYRNDNRTQTLYAIFSMLAIFVASLGLFGLAAFTTESRTREISIRKVMGAGEKRIVVMLSVQFARWVLLANLLAWPLAWLLMDNWLNHFAYRINMPWMVFLIAALLTLLLAMLTVLYQAIKAARTNPAEALKYE